VLALLSRALLAPAAARGASRSLHSVRCPSLPHPLSGLRTSRRRCAVTSVSSGPSHGTDRRAALAAPGARGRSRQPPSPRPRGCPGMGAAPAAPRRRRTCSARRSEFERFCPSSILVCIPVTVPRHPVGAAPAARARGSALAAPSLPKRAAPAWAETACSTCGHRCCCSGAAAARSTCVHWHRCCGTCDHCCCCPRPSLPGHRRVGAVMIGRPTARIQTARSRWAAALLQSVQLAAHGRAPSGSGLDDGSIAGDSLS
jgi:hypothetical protein